jgi:3'(2'), 5'-bisphosphate nucleotidase
LTNNENLKHLDDAQFATYLATETGKRLVELRKELVSRGFYGWDLKDAGDAMAQEFLMSQLREHRPNDAVLSEEATDSAARLSANRVWIIDPLDGTQEFSEPERQDWAVHVALWHRDETHNGDLIAGAVSLPALELTLSTDPPHVPPECR